MNKSMNHSWSWAKFFAMMCLSSLVLFAALGYAQETTGGIQGTVKDPQGAVVSGASVEVTSPALIGSKKAETDSGGYYRFANLPPGTYEISVTAKGFGSAKQTGLKLEVGALPSINFSLKVGGASEVVEVTGESQVVDVTQSKVQVSVTQAQIDSMPKGRSYQSLIPFAPGARQEPLQSNDRRFSGFSIDGASDAENTYLVEGMNTSEIQGGGAGKNVPFEFVQEVQIKSSSFEAEFGGATGGVINVIQKRGSNTWHGSGFTYFRSDALNANDPCGIFAACGLRGDPATTLNSTTRTDQTPQYYIPKKDHYRIVEPGFEVGGPLFKDRLWLFASYVPTIDRLNRTVNFNCTAGPCATTPKVGPRSFNQRVDTHNALSRLDYHATSKLNLYASWLYGYSRSTGTTLPNPDSAYGQFNTSSTTDPDSFRQEFGTVNPSAVYNFGGDYTITPRLVATVRYGYFFYNGEARGRPQGIRYIYQNTVNASSTNLAGGTFSAPFRQATGFQNMASNFKTLFDAFKRNDLAADIAYFRGNLWGTHNFKFGYANSRQANDINSGFDTAQVLLSYAQDYTPTDPNACNAIIASNVATYGASAAGHCRGNAGYYIVRDGVDVVGNVSTYSHAFYAQDSWNVGHGLTLNLGIRFDREFLPPYSVGAPNIEFGWGDKIAPRLGAAWDVMHNGKLKVYGSYGKFYDIMKFSLPRGSFGGDYWHDCVYAMDNEDYNGIQPGYVNNHSCPTTGGAPGVVPGRFIENVNFRSVILDPTNPGVDPDISPMRQHEYVVGSDWAITPKLSLEIRYARKRLDDTIEDIGIVVPGNELYFIGNPGRRAYEQLLQRTVVDSSSLPSTSYPAQCPTCPLSPTAMRNYDGLEFRLTKRASARWYGSMSYTYSRLYGNYSGLSSSDVNDRAGGRHGANNDRSFDQPQMLFTAHGQQQFGPLGTDRPHTLKLFGWYRAKWFHQETTFGFDQSIFSGTPLSTCWPTVNTASGCQFVENRGNFVQVSRDGAGNLVSSGVEKGKRTEPFTQTDFSLVHEVKVSKTNENLRLGFEWNIQNLFNQRNVLSVQTNPLAAGTASPLTPTGGFDWSAFTSTGWDYIARSNAQVRTFRNQYGMPNLFQGARQMRLKIKFTF